jgi:signal peptidase
MPEWPSAPSRRTVLNAAVLLVLLAVVVPFVVYAVPQVAGADDSFVVLSGSMEPRISAGDVVVTKAVGPDRIAVGDVITFVRSEGSAPVTHRVVGVDRSGPEPVFATKGDANQDADQSSVAPADVIGVVVLTLPYIGYVVQFVNTTAGFVALLVVPLALLVVTEAWAFLRGRRDDDAANDPLAPEATAAGAETVSEPAGPTATEQAPAGGLVITTADLRLTGAVLAVTAAYALYVATRLVEPLTVAVAAGLVVALLLVAVLQVAVRLGSDDAVEQSPTERRPATDGGDDAEVDE